MVAKAVDDVGLYPAPLENAVMPCVDEESQIRALKRSAPGLLIKLGQPAARTHDYIRSETSTLFGALKIATGPVTAACKPRHRRQQFRAFPKQIAQAYPDE